MKHSIFSHVHHTIKKSRSVWRTKYCYLLSAEQNGVGVPKSPSVWNRTVSVWMKVISFGEAAWRKKIVHMKTWKYIFFCSLLVLRRMTLYANDLFRIVWILGTHEKNVILHVRWFCSVTDTFIGFSDRMRSLTQSSLWMLNLKLDFRTNSWCCDDSIYGRKWCICSWKYISLVFWSILWSGMRYTHTYSISTCFDYNSNIIRCHSCCSMEWNVHITREKKTANVVER